MSGIFLFPFFKLIYDAWCLNDSFLPPETCVQDITKGEVSFSKTGQLPLFHLCVCFHGISLICLMCMSKWYLELLDYIRITPCWTCALLIYRQLSSRLAVCKGLSMYTYRACILCGWNFSAVVPISYVYPCHNSSTLLEVRSGRRLKIRFYIDVRKDWWC